MKCQRADCPNEVVRNNPRANNKKFCSKDCQHLNYQTVNAERIRADRDERNHAKYNQYEVGKEQCIICDGWFWAVCHHVAHRHKIGHRTYKRMIGADVGKGRLPERTKRIKRVYVFGNGTVENLKKGIQTRYKKGQKGVGVYQRSKETINRLKKQFDK